MKRLSYLSSNISILVVSSYSSEFQSVPVLSIQLRVPSVPVLLTMSLWFLSVAYGGEERTLGHPLLRRFALVWQSIGSKSALHRQRSRPHHRLLFNVHDQCSLVSVHGSTFTAQCSYIHGSMFTAPRSLFNVHIIRHARTRPRGGVGDRGTGHRQSVRQINCQASHTSSEGVEIVRCAGGSCYHAPRLGACT